MKTLTRKQAVAVNERIRPTIGYIVRLRERMAGPADFYSR